MTAWDQHHPPHDHPDFDAYFDTLTAEDLAAITAAATAAVAFETRNGELDDQQNSPKF